MQRELTIDGWYVTNVRKVNNEVNAQIWRYTMRVVSYIENQGVLFSIRYFDFKMKIKKVRKKTPR